MGDINTTDATRGMGLRSRVETRKHELESAIAKLKVGDHGRDDVERALNSIDGLLTGNLDDIPGVVAAELSRWLEANKHIAELAIEPSQSSAELQDKSG
jgi:hypothetical protein